MRIEDDLGSGFVRLHKDEAEARQALQDIACVEDALIELLRNSRDAQAKHIYLATYKRDTIRTLVVIDDGLGIPQEFHERIFEARVTSKLNTMSFDTWGVHGRGMALFSIKYHAIKAAVLASVQGSGTAFLVQFDTSTLRERREQSALPELWRSQDGLVQVRGPKNIYRMAAEFLLDSPAPPKLYVGSPTEIAATLLAHARMHMQLHNEDVSGKNTLASRLVKASSPAEFALAAHALGLEMSNRSARRILDGAIVQIPDFASYLSTHCMHEQKSELPSDSSSSKQIIYKETTSCATDEDGAQVLGSCTNSSIQRRTVKLSLSTSNQEELERVLKEALNPLFEAYYLERDVIFQFTSKQGSLHIEIPTLERAE